MITIQTKHSQVHRPSRVFNGKMIDLLNSDCGEITTTIPNSMRVCIFLSLTINSSIDNNNDARLYSITEFNEIPFVYR